MVLTLNASTLLSKYLDPSAILNICFLLMLESSSKPYLAWKLKNTSKFSTGFSDKSLGENLELTQLEINFAKV